MKRTLLFENQELLDFEVDFATCEIRVLDAPDADDALLCSLGLGGPDRDAFVAECIRMRRMSEKREGAKQILEAFGARSTLELAFMLAEAKRRKEGGDHGFEAILVPAC